MTDFLSNPHYTDPKLAADLLALVPMTEDDTYLDPCCGLNKVFLAQAVCRKRHWCEIELGQDFFAWRKPVDWIVSNPPFHVLWRFHLHSLWLATKGIGWLLSRTAWQSFSPRRLELMANRGWYVRRLHIVEVKRWQCRYYFCVFLREVGDCQLTWSCRKYD